MPRKRKRSWLDWLGIALLAVAVLPVSWRFSPRARGAMLYLTGQTQMCNLEQAWNAEAGSAGKLAELTEMAKATRAQEIDQEGNRLLRTPKDGDFWIPENDFSTLFLLLLEQHENIYGAGEEGVKPGDVVFDCGAHVGVYTRKALRQGASLVVAFEPNPRTARCYRKNFAAEIGSGKVIFIEKGVWDKEGALPLYSNDTTAGNSFVLHHSDNVVATLPLTTIDKVAGDLKLTRVDFLKLDIEGAERNALAGAAATIRKHHPRMAVAGYHLPDDPQAITAAIRTQHSDYRVRCTSCEHIDGRVAPHTLLFH